jgi:hypothetical protein
MSSRTQREVVAAAAERRIAGVKHKGSTSVGVSGASGGGGCVNVARFEMANSLAGFVMVDSSTAPRHTCLQPLHTRIGRLAVRKLMAHSPSDAQLPRA